MTPEQAAEREAKRRQKEITDTITVLQKQVDVINKEIRDRNKEVREIENRIGELKTGFVRGDWVEYKHGNGRRRGRIESYDSMGWVQVRQFTLNGEMGCIVNLYTMNGVKRIDKPEGAPE